MTVSRVKVRLPSKFPATVTVASPLVLNRSGGTYAFSLNQTLLSIVPLNLGGTGTNLSATGGAHQFLKQSSAGASITVAAITAADGGFGADISASSGVPLFATGVATFTGTSGTGNFARVTSPTFTTPIIGVATATSLNGLTVTTTTGTLTLTNLKTLAVSNSLTLAGVDGSTLTFQATDTYVGRATTDTLTNKTFDTAGTGNVFKIAGTTITANTGTGSNVLGTSPTLTTPNIVGTVTNDNAAVGSAGEYASATLASGSATALTTTVAKDVITISLTAGDWDVSAVCLFTGAASTTVTNVIASISTTLNTLDSTVGQRFQNWYNGGTVFNALDPSLNCGTVRMSLSGTTTVRLVARCDFGTSTASAYGTIRARRVR